MRFMVWDDYRYFLELARSGSATAAANACGVSRTTVARRVAHLESRLNCRLFERLPGGYRVTEHSEELLRIVEQMERLVHEIDLKAVGHDASVEGVVRVSAHRSLAKFIIMPAFANLAETHPALQLDIHTGNEPYSIRHREVDVAVLLTPSPDAELIGRRLAKPAYAPYVDRNTKRPEYLILSATDNENDYRERWAFDGLDARLKVADDLEKAEAVRSSNGVAILPCFVGDTSADLVRAGAVWRHSDQHIWVVTHRDLIHSGRIRAFLDNLYASVASMRQVIEGEESSASQGAETPNAHFPYSAG